jgi:hydrogenase-4 membrane subunit HyfE
MSALFALIASFSVSVWIFTKLQNKTGYGNNKNAMIGAAVVFVLGFIVIFSLANLLSPN